MNIIETNFNAALDTIAALVEKEKNNLTSRYIVVQVAYNENSFELYSAALSPSESEYIGEEKSVDNYYNLVFMVDGMDEIVNRFKDKYLFRLAYADISFSLNCAYMQALRSANGEYTLRTSFLKPTIENFAWAYNDVFRFSDLGKFGCWFSYDDNYNNVDIQADTDMIAQYEELSPALHTNL